MKHMTPTVRMSLVFLAGASLVACAPFFEGRSWQPSPGTHVVQASLRPSIGYYESAVAAINARRYALALEYLQTARAQKPDDVRVLTAFGVVYDKLGRFDLSARYYAQAAAVDPQSRIVASDRDYSRRLQGVAAADPAPRAARTASARAGELLREAAAELPQAPVTTMSVMPVDTLVKRATSQQAGMSVENQIPSKLIVDASMAKGAFLTGYPLMIVDASGGNDSGKSVRSYLSGLGWTLSKGEDPKLPARAQTVIVYREPMLAVAKALARTLYLPMRLTASNDVQGLQLVLGGDITGANLAGRALRPQRRQLALVIANTKKQE